MKYYKYPRTKHVPWSRSKGEDDKEHSSMERFIGMEVVVTEKMDGESCTIYHRGFIHARSIDSRHHESRNWVKALAGSIGHLIPKNFRICGENLYAEHSIAYTDLDSYFHGFSVWNDQNIALSWDDTLKFFSEVGVTPVKELYRGVYNEELIKSLWDKSKHFQMEGYVIRYAGEIPYDEFGNLVAKFVRKGHVTTTEHWMTKAIVANKLK